MKDSANLDLLRSIAVALVVLSHIPVIVEADWQTYSRETMGKLGVAIFFLHTTLVLMLSMQRNGGQAAPFLIRRAFRIYPLSIAIVTLTALIMGFGNVDTGQLVSNLLLIQNITGHESNPGPLWTLPYEVQMYLVLPALYAVTLSRRPLLWVSLIFAVSVGIGLVALSTEFRLLRYVPCFLPGVLAFVLGGRARLSPLVLFAVVSLAVALVPALVAAGLPETPLFWGVCLILGLTIPMCRELTHRPTARAAKVVATHSYGIYLTHVLALGCGFAGLVPGPWFMQWGVFLIMLAGFSRMAYRFIEAPGIALGVRLSRRRSQAPLSAA